MTTTRTQIRTEIQDKRAEALRLMLQQEQAPHFSQDDWDTLEEHVETHKFLINRDIPWVISWDDAVFSWHENVFVPLRNAIQRWDVRASFPGTSDGKLYLGVSTHWYYLMQENPRVTAEVAARDFAAQYGVGLAAWFSRHL